MNIRKIATNIVLCFGVVITSALLVVAMSLFAPVAPVALAGGHDCTATARAGEMVEEAAAACNGNTFGVINHCPCGKAWIWDPETRTWSRA